MMSKKRSVDRAMDQRQIDSYTICDAYEEVEKALQKVGRVLRTTEAGKYIWAGEHKTAVAGLRIAVKHLKKAVPKYDGTE